MGVTVEAISQEVINGNHCFMRVIRMINEQKGGTRILSQTGLQGGAEVDAGGRAQKGSSFALNTYDEQEGER